jgi:heat shock protein HtpX
VHEADLEPRAAPRNRARMGIVTLVSALNYWVVVAAVAWYVSFAVVGAIFGDRPVPWGLPLCIGAAVGVLVVGLVVWRQFRRIEERALQAVGAAPVAAGDFPQLENILAELAIAMGLPPARAAIIADAAPNAFAVGRRADTSWVAVTSGLIELLSRDELEAVMASQLCSVGRLDVGVGTVALACTGNTIAIWNAETRLHRAMAFRGSRPGRSITWLPMVIAEALRAWAIRGRSFDADFTAVAYTRHPHALLRALEKLHADNTVVAGATRATAHLWFEYPLAPDTRSPSRVARHFERLVPLTDRIQALKSYLHEPVPTGHRRDG